ncbi:protein of unknown function (DUF4538) [Tyrophagus putrescentiae]|nr:protein of unknown function (DUF4538) [Tyrophagus putrescentiae]
MIPLKTKPSPRGVLMPLAIVGAIIAALYPIAIHPYLHIEQYQKSQKVNRSGVNRQAVQPGGMRVWSDPFEPRN